MDMTTTQQTRMNFTSANLDMTTCGQQQENLETGANMDLRASAPNDRKSDGACVAGSEADRGGSMVSGVSDWTKDTVFDKDNNDSNRKVDDTNNFFTFLTISLLDYFSIVLGSH